MHTLVVTLALVVAAFAGVRLGKGLRAWAAREPRRVWLPPTLHGVLGLVFAVGAALVLPLVLLSTALGSVGLTVAELRLRHRA